MFNYCKIQKYITHFIIIIKISYCSFKTVISGLNESILCEYYLKRDSWINAHVNVSEQNKLGRVGVPSQVDSSLN